MAHISQALDAPYGGQPHAQCLGWQRALETLPREHDFEALRVEGQVPSDLTGVAYFNGPGAFERFAQPYGSWLDCDGAVAAVALNSSQVRGAVKLLSTSRHRREQLRGRPLYASPGTRASSRLHGIGPWVKNAANTNVFAWQGRLFALYEADVALEVSRSIDSLRSARFGMVPPWGTFCAHPHRVPKRRAAYGFGFRAGLRSFMLDAYEFPDVGRPRRITSLPIPFGPLVHDFAVTERHIVFLIPPLRTRALPMITGSGSIMEHLQWHENEGAEVVVIPIDDPRRVTRFETDAFSFFHVANAFDSDDSVIIHLSKASYPLFAPAMTLAAIRDPQVPIPTGSLNRVRIRPGREELTMERVMSRSMEMPRICESMGGDRARFAYMLGHAAHSKSKFFDRVLKVDLETGLEKEINYGVDRYPSEPLFVRRANASNEDDGYLLSLVYDAARHQSHVAIVDAKRPLAGPVARAWFDHFIPHRFHGTWVASE